MTTLSFDAPLQLFFYALEVHAGVGFALFVLSVWDTESLVTVAPRDETPLRIAVCIATYNEDENVLLPTVAAAVALQPAHETWVLDDGDRPWVAAMAEQLGARYLTRADRSHAKAGNLNNAFAVIDADLFAVLDADHIPTTNFLRHTLGYFDDPKVALVQTPQDFYNRDSFEHVGDYCEEALFYRVIQPGKNRWKAAFWCGTSAVVRGDAIRSIGGAATESVTEDLLTTMKLHRSGWQTVFHDEVLARGLAPASYREYLVQRLRWATGAMQILRSRENPWRGRGLTITQRLAYTASLNGWFDGLRTIGYLLLAVAVVLTGAMPVEADMVPFLLANLGLLAVTTIAQIQLGNGRHRPMPALLFEVLRLPMSVHAVRQLLFGKHAAFQVTPKGRSGDERTTPPLPGLLVGLGVAAIAGLVVYVMSRLRVIDGPIGRHVDVAAVVLVAQLSFLAAAARRIRRRDFGDERRRARRFARELRFHVGAEQGLLRNPSTTGGHIAGRAMTSRDVLTVLTREGPTDVRCWITPDGFGGSTVEFVPGQYRVQAVLARTIYGELQDMPIATATPPSMAVHDRRALLRDRRSALPDRGSSPGPGEGIAARRPEERRSSAPPPTHRGPDRARSPGAMPVREADSQHQHR